MLRPHQIDLARTFTLDSGRDHHAGHFTGRLQRRTIAARVKGSEHAGIYRPGGGRISKSYPMKAANAILLTMVLQGSVALSQATPTEKGGEWYL